MTTETEKDTVVVVLDDWGQRMGLRCPSCHKSEDFALELFGIARLTADKLEIGDPMTHSHSSCHCLSCGYDGDGESTVIDYSYTLQPDDVSDEQRVWRAAQEDRGSIQLDPEG